MINNYGVNMRFIINILVFLLFSCSPQIMKSVNPDDNKYILWDKDKKLTWEDFQGDVLNQDNSMSCEIFVINPSSLQQNFRFLPAEFEAKALFDKSKSWVNRKYSSDQLLKYNQIIFNIYELYMRKLKKEISTTDLGFLNPIGIYQKMAEENTDDLYNKITEFRNESNIGREKSAIEKWDIEIINQINVLSDFK